MMHASFIVTKRRAYWSRFTDRHDDIIKEYGIKDGVNVRMDPPKGDMRYSPSRWTCTQAYGKPDRDVEKRVRAELLLWLRAKLIVGGKHKIREGRVYAYDADLTLYGHATAAVVDSKVLLYDYSKVVCRGNTTAELRNYSKGHFYDKTVGYLQDCSVARVWHPAYITAAFDYARVWYVEGPMELFDEGFTAGGFLATHTKRDNGDNS